MGQSEYPTSHAPPVAAPEADALRRRADRDEAENGVEVAFLYNGEISYRRVWPTRGEAMADADAKRSELEREGWMLHW